MNSKHTPGPWTAWDDDGTGTLPCVLSDKLNAGGNFYVAQCNNYGDARAIAEVPAMIEALRECADWLCEAHPHSDQWERGQKARALLKRIED